MSPFWIIALKLFVHALESKSKLYVLLFILYAFVGSFEDECLNQSWSLGVQLSKVGPGTKNG